MERHPFDIISFAFGVIFGGLGLVFLITEVRAFDISYAWLWPALAILIGAALLISTLRSARQRGDS